MSYPIIFLQALLMLEIGPYFLSTSRAVGCVSEASTGISVSYCSNLQASFCAIVLHYFLYEYCVTAQICKMGADEA